MFKTLKLSFVSLCGMLFTNGITTPIKYGRHALQENTDIPPSCYTAKLIPEAAKQLQIQEKVSLKQLKEYPFEITKNQCFFK